MQEAHRIVVELPPGKHRFLIRARSASRLSVNGGLLAETPFPPKNGGDGSQADTERLVPLDLGPGYRFSPRGEYEKIAEFETDGGLFDVKFDVFAGGREGKNPRRVEVGETVVAIAKSGTEMWELLSPLSEAIPYTDAAWEAYRAHVAKVVFDYSAAARAALRDKNSAYWALRREAANAWLASTPEVSVPSLPAGYSAENPIDPFIATKFATVKSQNRRTASTAHRAETHYMDQSPATRIRSCSTGTDHGCPKRGSTNTSN